MLTVESTASSFVIRCGRVRYEVHEAANGRWYIARKVNGRVTDDASYASRRSARRAIRARCS